MSIIRFNPYARGQGPRRHVVAPGSPPHATLPMASSEPKIKRRLEIEGLTFELIHGGKKLKRLTPTNADAPQTPPSHEIAGVKFYRTKGGNLLRGKEYLELEEKQLSYLSLTAEQVLTRYPSKRRLKEKREPCIRFTTTGVCERDCRFKHDFNKVAACKHFLFKGDCRNGPDCPLSHDLTAERVPHCTHFAHDKCTAGSNCAFVHVKPAAGAQACYSFGKLGYCPAGSDCPNVHLFQCPDYANKGSCENQHCRLPHVEKAVVMRKMAGAVNGASTDDIHSEDDCQVLTSGDEQTAAAFSKQDDFIRLVD